MNCVDIFQFSHRMERWQWWELEEQQLARRARITIRHRALLLSLCLQAPCPLNTHPPSNSISPTKSNTLYNRTHCILCQTLWNPVESKRGSASKEAKMASVGRYARIARQHLPPEPLNQPTLGRGHTLVACGRSSIDRHSPPPDRNFADLLLIDTGCRLLPDFVHQTPDICQLICPPGSSQPLFQHL